MKLEGPVSILRLPYSRLQNYNGLTMKQQNDWSHLPDRFKKLANSDRVVVGFAVRIKVE